ncbi:MAG: AAA family ATPase [Ruminococcus sp.]|uniref:ATP-binding protein n=1 Tax=Ruminococcus sp. TaxID=41978 RepID=UPI002872C872|nr:SbcC/MukB-like Walker B domain-containing protein [Ruminococcus sp.]MBQ3285243.1 AAA family ATPase [Ruminococcus sp.]
MKTLKKLLLINWHYFSHQMIEFEQLNFMTGGNASGKSTIIDALQLVLFGDTAGRYFNKSASGKSARTLASYLCGEISDNAEGGFHYLREGRFTGYTAVEFYDDEKQRSFVFGEVFDVYSPSDIVTRFFRYYGEIPADHFIENGVPMEIAKLREFFKYGAVKDARFFESGVSYRNDIYAMLGALQSKFRDLLKKAIAFNPDNNIQKFITEFVCDTEKPVDIGPMQENIRSYKNLERTAQELERKKTALQAIADCYAELEKNKESEKLYSYLIQRAEQQKREEKLLTLHNEVSAAEETLRNVEENLSFEKENQSILSKQVDDLKWQLREDKTAIRSKEIAAEITERTARIDRAKQEFDRSLSQIQRTQTRFFSARNEVLSRIDSLDHCETEDGIIDVQLDSLFTELEKVSEQFERIKEVSPEKIIAYSEEEFRQIIDAMGALKETATVLHSKLTDAVRAADEKLAALKAEKEELEKGRFQFPQNALDLKQAIISQIHAKTGNRAQVTLVAEAAEIKSDRWRNVIEGYLNTQKFYVIVPERYVRIAVSVLNRMKRDRAVYDTGVVDTEKIMRRNPKAEENSLAQELTTENPYVRAFLNYVLGRVRKCDDPDRVRDYPVSVTDEGLLYKNYVVRAMNPALWKRPAIGQSAIINRLSEIERETAHGKQLLVGYSTLKKCAEGCKILSCFSIGDAERFADTAKALIDSREDEKAIDALTAEKESLDMTNVLMLRQQLADKEGDLKETSAQIEAYQRSIGEIGGQLKNLKEEKIPQTESELSEITESLSAEFEPDWVNDKGEPRYLYEYSKRKNAGLIADAFPREKRKAENAIAKFRESLVTQRTKFNDAFKTGYDVKEEDNSEYNEALQTISENTLPDYLSRIEDTKQKAMEEFQEDFLSKLSENIRSVKLRIKELNLAISSASFGDDTYSFRVEPKKDYERFYKMITDDMLMLGYALMANQFNEKYREEINELFSIMTGEGNTALSQSDYEKRVRLFTDYRTYLDFDIEVKNKDGEVQRLSRTIDKKSGGETQTPFYIAVLASFAQLYHIGKGRDQSTKTPRLIIFDEAFSKMDGDRIEKSIILLRKIGFQVILSTPTEKAGDIAPLVDRTILVLRSGRHSQVTCFDKEGMGELLNE